MSAKLVLLLLSLYFKSSHSQSCPDPTAWRPCSCTENDGDIIINCSGEDQNEVDIDLPDAFARLADFLDPNQILKQLTLDTLNNAEIPAGATGDFQFEIIRIFNNQKLSQINPEAFRASAEATKVLELGLNHGLNFVPPNQHQFFNLVNAFNNLESVLLSDSSLLSIPEGAFTKSQNLMHLTFMWNDLEEIGPSAFAPLSNLNEISISFNELSSAGLSALAFENINPTANVTFSQNRFQYLDEAKFKNHLDTTLGALKVGQNSPDLVCDSRGDWICDDMENYREKLIGYDCIWNYCVTGSTGSTIPTTTSSGSLFATTRTYLSYALLLLLGKLNL